MANMLILMAAHMTGTTNSSVLNDQVQFFYFKMTRCNFPIFKQPFTFILARQMPCKTRQAASTAAA